jgi:hypothetical protein
LESSGWARRRWARDGGQDPGARRPPPSGRRPASRRLEGGSILAFPSFVHDEDSIGAGFSGRGTDSEGVPPAGLPWSHVECIHPWGERQASPCPPRLPGNHPSPGVGCPRLDPARSRGDPRAAGAGHQRDRPGEQAHHRGDRPRVIGSTWNFRRGLAPARCRLPAALGRGAPRDGGGPTRHCETEPGEGRCATCAAWIYFVRCLARPPTSFQPLSRFRSGIAPASPTNSC